MNIMRLVGTSIALSITLAGGTANAQAQNTDGTIIFREGDGVTKCSITATPGDHSFQNGNGSVCKSDQYYTVRFENIPSARNITFFDDAGSDYCKDNEGWETEVRTIKNPTTTPEENYMDLSAMNSAADNSIILPGVLKIRSVQKGQVHGKLTCVRIEDNK